MTKVSVIVPTFRDDAGLLSTLRALAAQTHPAADTEILVVDNTPEFALRGRELGDGRVTLLHEPRKGAYAARNRALTVAAGDVLCFTDADCEPEPEWIARGVTALAAAGGDALIAGAIEVFPQDPARPTAIEVLELLTAFPQRAYAELHQFGATANVAIGRRVIETIGPFNDRIASGGDREFGQRVHRAGFPVVYAADVKVRHPARRTLRAFLAKRRRTIGGVLALERPGELLRGRFAKGLIADVRPPIATSLLLLRRRDLGPWMRRLRAVPVLWYARYYSAGYRIAAVARHLLGRGARTTEASARDLPTVTGIDMRTCTMLVHPDGRRPSLAIMEASDAENGSDSDPHGPTDLRRTRCAARPRRRCGAGQTRHRYGVRQRV